MPDLTASTETSLIRAETPPLQMDEQGVIRVAGSRLTLDTIAAAFLDGESAEAIADQYPSATLADVYASISYFLAHREAVEAYLARRGALAEMAKGKIEQ